MEKYHIQKLWPIAAVGLFVVLLGISVFASQKQTVGLTEQNLMAALTDQALLDLVSDDTDYYHIRIPSLPGWR